MFKCVQDTTKLVKLMYELQLPVCDRGTGCVCVCMRACMQVRTWNFVRREGSVAIVLTKCMFSEIRRVLSNKHLSHIDCLKAYSMWFVLAWSADLNVVFFCVMKQLLLSCSLNNLDIKGNQEFSKAPCMARSSINQLYELLEPSQSSLWRRVCSTLQQLVIWNCPSWKPSDVYKAAHRKLATLPVKKDWI